LDLCLSCKACKAECPSRVDLARLKGEFLQHYYDARGSTFRDRLIGGAADVARRLGGPGAPIVNALQGSILGRWGQRLLGFDGDRRLPPYAREPFHEWFESRGPGFASGQPVALFVDTYLDVYEPDVGRAAVHLLESFGFTVELARVGCCQRTRISHGFLRDAAARGTETMKRLGDIIERGVPIVACEPSCASALVDDLPDLIDDAQLGRRVHDGVQMIDVFLAEAVASGAAPAPKQAIAGHFLLHGHCHQKALFGTDAMQTLLTSVPGVEVTVLDTGCCGMAGSFGYEAEHAELSRKIAASRLLPALEGARTNGTVVIAPGFSCRHQIADLADLESHHWVETLRGPMAE